MVIFHTNLDFQPLNPFKVAMKSINPEFAAFHSKNGALGLIQFLFPSSDFTKGVVFPP